MAKKSRVTVELILEVNGEPDQNTFVDRFIKPMRSEIIWSKIVSCDTIDLGKKENKKIKDINVVKKFIRGLIPGDYKIRYRCSEKNGIDHFELFKDHYLCKYFNIGAGRVEVYDVGIGAISLEMTDPQFTEKIAKWWESVQKEWDEISEKWR